MTKFSVDLEELAGVAEEMQSFQRSFERRLEDLEKLVSDLHLTWTGQAAAAHLQAHEQWTTGAREMHQGISDMHKAAITAHDNYHSSATSNADMWSRTR
jgi:WXG100 family type VII secretion target